LRKYTQSLLRYGSQGVALAALLAAGVALSTVPAWRPLVALLLRAGGNYLQGAPLS
jgi:hypothetical protein